MSADLERLRERLEQQRAARVRTAAENLAAAAGGGLHGGRLHAPGDRVFDLVSGQEGEVLSGTRENVVVSTPER